MKQSVKALEIAGQALLFSSYVLGAVALSRAARCIAEGHYKPWTDEAWNRLLNLRKKRQEEAEKVVDAETPEKDAKEGA